MSTAVAVATAVAVTSGNNAGGGHLGPSLWFLLTLLGVFLFLTQQTEIKYNDPHHKEKTFGFSAATAFWAIGNFWYVNAWINYEVHIGLAVISGFLALLASIFIACLGEWIADPKDIAELTAKADARVAEREKFVEERSKRIGPSRFGFVYYDDPKDWYPSEEDVLYAKNRTRNFFLNLLGAVVFTALANFFLLIY